METAIITEVESEFNGIYRVKTNNGMIIDLMENNKPNLGSKLEYSLFFDGNNYSTIPKQHTVMNGIIYRKNHSCVYVSFGGLLSVIPFENPNWLTSDTVSIIYGIKD
jgi:hypothetical protein